MQFKSLMENQTSNKIKALVNDQGSGYTSIAFETFLANHGICMRCAIYHPAEPRG